MTKTESTIPALPLRPTAPAAAGFACFVNDYLWGIGATEEEARADAERHTEDGFTKLDSVSVAPSSAALLAEPDSHRVEILAGLAVTKAEAAAYEAALFDWEEDVEAWIEAARPGWSLAPNFDDGDLSEDEYRDLLEAMARSFSEGNARVRLTKRTGTPVWADSDAPSPNLSCYSDRAIKEIGRWIGHEAAEDARFRLIKPRQDELATIASAIWEGGWKDSLAQELGIDPRRVQRWAAGDARVPIRILAEIKTGPIMARARAAASAEVSRLRTLLARAEKKEIELQLDANAQALDANAQAKAVRFGLVWPFR